MASTTATRRSRRARTAAAALAAAAVLLAAGLLAVSMRAGGASAPPARMLIHLSADGRGDYATLAEAVRMAPDGATVYLAPGTYRLEQPLDIFRSLRVVGVGRQRTRVTCAARGRVLGFSGNGWLAAIGITFAHIQPAAQGAAASGVPEPADAVVALGGRVAFDRCRFAGGAGDRHARGEGVGLRLLGDSSGAISRCLAVGNSGPAYWVADGARPLFVSDDARDNGLDGVWRPRRRGPAGAAAFARFLDPIVTRVMADEHIPGTVVVLVQEGEVVFAKGYGFANVERRLPVSPAGTVFRVGSITKTFTATAVLQLWERRRLDLRDDVNGYLGGGRLPNTYPRPVTIGDLLTHSGGLDDSSSGTAARELRAAVPLADCVAAHLPTRIAPPGRVFSYSNNGMALAGLVVERASGMPYERFVGVNILTPLGMSRSGFVPPGAAGAQMAVSYDWSGGRPVPRALDYPCETASTGLVASGLDMARFMVAQLEGGRSGSAVLLQPATMALMQRQQFTNAEGLPGATYGFQERFANGRRAIQHTGDWGGFASALVLMPDERLGLFVASNGGGASLREEVVGRFLDRYFPEQVTLGPPPPPPDFATRAQRFAGTYRATRYDHASFARIFELSADSEVTVGADAEALTVGSRRFVEIEPLSFEEIDSGGRIAFATDLRGRTAYLFEGTAAFERLAWYETFTFNRRLLIAIVLVFALTLVAWPGALLAKRRRRAGEPRLAGAARLLAAVVAGLDLAFLAGLGLALERVDFVYGVPGWFVALLVLPNVTALMSLPLPALAVTAWWRRYWTPVGRAGYTVTTTAALAFVWFCATWNLLGLRV